MVDFKNITDPYKKHIALFYRTFEELEDALVSFLQEGLKRNDLCMFGLLNQPDSMWDRLEQKIDNFDYHMSNSNLVYLPVNFFYTTARKLDLSIYEKEKQLISTMNDERKVRLVGDVAGTLWHSGHFDAWIQLEEWWQKHPLGTASVVCPYSNELLSEEEHQDYVQRLIKTHDIVAQC